MKVVKRSRTIFFAEDLVITENGDLRILVRFIDSLTSIGSREDSVGFVKAFIS